MFAVANRTTVASRSIEKLKMHKPKNTNFHSEPGLTTELLLLPDGRILVHNLTQPFAELLAQLNPNCEQIASRTTNPTPRPNELPN